MDKKILQYNTFSSFIDPGFWHKFTQIKLDIDKLEGQRKKIWGRYRGDIGNFFEVDCTAFNSTPDLQRNNGLSHGILLNKNTIEDFKDCDKASILNEEGKLLWEDVESGACIDNPSLLSRFAILSFADLKSFQYLFWFAFLAPSHPFVYLVDKPELVINVFNETQINSFIKSYSLLDTNQKSFFAIEMNDANANAVPVAGIINKIIDTGTHDENVYFGFLDPSITEYPGWVLRNFITLLSFKCSSLHGKNLKFVALRFGRTNEIVKSLLYVINIPENLEGEWGKNWVGWERNEKGNFGPRIANMASTMDPFILAESSVDLNLKLMKWRLLPNLDLNIIKNTRCLLLGAGTLGCAVARNILAWGVRTITFIDYGKVSFSNPVRQSLFMHKDCLNGGDYKAFAASNNLRDIFPGVNSRGVVMHIPMPGHPVGESLIEVTHKEVNLLTEMITTHDVIFLLLDSREARWLPTLLAGFHNKIVINAALGFDSYLIMRHGIYEQDEVTNEEKTQSEQIKQHFIPGHKLGCYFCNDITSPGNSLKDRTLDQQCTVTRPGVSNIAGALASEMAIAIIQHKRKLNAVAAYNYSGEVEDDESILGAIPHSIRGFLTNYQQVLPSSAKFEQCIACSSKVMEEFKLHGISFLMKVFNDVKYLEDITGLTSLHIEADNAEIWALSDNEEE